MLEPVQTVQIFEDKADIQAFSAGQEIFKQGEVGQCLYGILDGEVEMQVNGKVVETLLKGDIFGEGALVHIDKTRYSTAIAKTNCKLAAMTERHFIFAVQETPMFALEVMRSYSDRFRRLKSMM
ncbi:MAG TPA: cyclic nucleotide-binding domain-containing protein [Leptolyngbyaceae cyanobacterium M33_DOE_097]|uniref:Cyclic nucleotide-binding domain-containing protein n=1 Tax=Oscillatoriales cyanobacterium SpSt-418 TaxID=2282169 RepID=A0A7C3PD05_9CYAN|nr:cyclic nucleotide-binding domain-containing protein [Leptolyngbyaceae cyanobacterium M33_DOE_097]